MRAVEGASEERNGRGRTSIVPKRMVAEKKRGRPLGEGNLLMQTE